MKTRRTVRAILMAFAAIVLLSIGSIWLASVQTGESMGAFTVRVIILPVLNAKGAMRTVDAYQAIVKDSRTRGEAPPGKSLRKRYRISQEELGGGTVYTVESPGEAAAHTVIFIHGGAYIAPMISLQWDLVEAMAEMTGARVIVPQYPLAPEHDWKQGYSMIEALYDRLATQIPSRSITISGDSAGAGLALGFVEEMRDKGKPLPGGIILFSPWLNLLADNPAQAALEDRDPLLSRPALVWAAQQWAKDTPLSDPHISPVLGSLKGLPPIMLFSGTADLLHADALELAGKAASEGTPLTYVEGKNMTHAWCILPFSDSKTLQRQAAAFILRKTD